MSIITISSSGSVVDLSVYLSYILKHKLIGRRCRPAFVPNAPWIVLLRSTNTGPGFVSMSLPRLTVPQFTTVLYYGQEWAMTQQTNNITIHRGKHTTVYMFTKPWRGCFVVVCWCNFWNTHTMYNFHQIHMHREWWFHVKYWVSNIGSVHRIQYS